MPGRVHRSSYFQSKSETEPSFSQDSLVHQLDAYLGLAANYREFNGSVLIAKGDSILLAKGYGWRDVRLAERNDAYTIYQLGSLTKPITAEMILLLVEKGELSLHDKLAKFLPDFPNGELAGWPLGGTGLRNDPRVTV